MTDSNNGGLYGLLGVGLRYVGTLQKRLSIIFGTEAGTVAPGEKLPGPHPIDTTGATADQTLVYNAGSGKFVPGTASGGSGAGAAFKYASPSTSYPTITALIAAMVTDGATDATPLTGVIAPGPYTEDLTLAPGVQLSVLGGGGATLTGDVTYSPSVAGITPRIEGLAITGHVLIGGTHDAWLTLINCPVVSPDSDAAIQISNPAGFVKLDTASYVQNAAGLAIEIVGAGGVNTEGSIYGDLTQDVVSLDGGYVVIGGVRSTVEGAIRATGAALVTLKGVRLTTSGAAYGIVLADASFVDVGADVTIDCDAATTIDGTGTWRTRGPVAFEYAPVFASTVTIVGPATVDLAFASASRLGAGSAAADVARLADCPLFFCVYVTPHGGGDLPAYTYSAGTITFTLAGEVAPDTASPAVGDVVYLINADALEDTGLYRIDVVGDESTQAVWSRLPVMPHGGVLAPYGLFVRKGTVGAGTLAFQTAKGTIGTDHALFATAPFGPLTGDLDAGGKNITDLAGLKLRNTAAVQGETTTPTVFGNLIKMDDFDNVVLGEDGYALATSAQSINFDVSDDVSITAESGTLTLASPAGNVVVTASTTTAVTAGTDLSLTATAGEASLQGATTASVVAGTNIVLSTYGGYVLTQGGRVEPVTRTNGNPYVATAADYRIHFITAAACSLTLPTAPADGTVLKIKDAYGQGATHNITINRGGGDTIEGATSKVISTNYGGCTLVYDAGAAVWMVDL